MSQPIGCWSEEGLDRRLQPLWLVDIRRTTACRVGAGAGSHVGCAGDGLRADSCGGCADCRGKVPSDADGTQTGRPIVARRAQRSELRARLLSTPLSHSRSVRERGGSGPGKAGTDGGVRADGAVPGAFPPQCPREPPGWEQCGTCDNCRGTTVRAAAVAQAQRDGSQKGGPPSMALGVRRIRGRWIEIGDARSDFHRDCRMVHSSGLGTSLRRRRNTPSTLWPLVRRRRDQFLLPSFARSVTYAKWAVSTPARFSIRHQDSPYNYP